MPEASKASSAAIQRAIARVRGERGTRGLFTERLFFGGCRRTGLRWIKSAANRMRESASTGGRAGSPRARGGVVDEPAGGLQSRPMNQAPLNETVAELLEKGLS
jgi:hypothetical protein